MEKNLDQLLMSLQLLVLKDLHLESRLFMHQAKVLLKILKLLEHTELQNMMQLFLDVSLQMKAKKKLKKLDLLISTMSTATFLLLQKVFTMLILKILVFLQVFHTNQQLIQSLKENLEAMEFLVFLINKN